MIQHAVSYALASLGLSIRPSRPVPLDPSTIQQIILLASRYLLTIPIQPDEAAIRKNVIDRGYEVGDPDLVLAKQTPQATFGLGIERAVTDVLIRHDFPISQTSDVVLPNYEKLMDEVLGTLQSRGITATSASIITEFKKRRYIIPPEPAPRLRSAVPNDWRMEVPGAYAKGQHFAEPRGISTSVHQKSRVERGDLGRDVIMPPQRDQITQAVKEVLLRHQLPAVYPGMLSLPQSVLSEVDSILQVRGTAVEPEGIISELKRRHYSVIPTTSTRLQSPPPEQWREKVPGQFTKGTMFTQPSGINTHPSGRIRSYPTFVQAR